MREVFPGQMVKMIWLADVVPLWLTSTGCLNHKVAFILHFVNFPPCITGLATDAGKMVQDRDVLKTCSNEQGDDNYAHVS